MKNKKARNSLIYICEASAIAALYTAITVIIGPFGNAAVQCRISEAMCILPVFTPAAIPGLTIGCLLFNITSGAALPLDFLVGSLASLLAATGMWFARKWTVRGLPLLGFFLPALTNALLVGWELTHYIGGGFWINALYVAIGELAVLLTLGILLFYALRSRGLDRKLFE